MIDFHKNKAIKAYSEIITITGDPSLLFSNDRKQCNAEAAYNMYTIQTLNKLIKKDRISVSELELGRLYDPGHKSLCDFPF
ncbi:hypothetical protein J22TS3_31710 [Paenibacillus sp. J22TS3]|nr:hypothetical protein J22TS3_31710 [Paenibacillus sp. J22TS3]